MICSPYYLYMEEFVVVTYCCMIPDCAKTYNSKFNLKRHIELAHLSVTRFRCDLCGKGFASKQSCIEHRHLHTGKKPFVCRICNLRLRQASQLSLHKRSHTEQERLAACRANKSRRLE